MYRSFFKKSWFLLFTLIIFLAAVFWLVFNYTNSLSISASTAILALLVWRFIFGGGLRKRRRPVNELASKGFDQVQVSPTSQGNAIPILNDQPKIESWKKGIGFTDDVNQPMWVSVDPQGIILFFLCYSRKPAIRIPWDRISQLSIKQHSFSNAVDLFARLFIPGLGMKIIVPWESQFNNFVPDSVALEKKPNTVDQ